MICQIKRNNSNDLNNKVKKEKRIVYGEYKIDRKKPIYLKNNEYKKGLTTDEVEERKEKPSSEYRWCNRIQF